MRWYYACRVRKGTVFIKGIYTSGNSRMAELVRPNIPKKIVDVRAWDDIMHKVHNGTVFIKGIYSSGNSRKAELVRPNIQKKIAECMRWYYIKTQRYIYAILQGTHAWPSWFARTSKRKRYCRYCIYQRNLYFRELTHGRTGSPEHPKENSRCACMRWYYA